MNRPVATPAVQFQGADSNRHAIVFGTVGEVHLHYYCGNVQTKRTSEQRRRGKRRKYRKEKYKKEILARKKMRLSEDQHMAKLPATSSYVFAKTGVFDCIDELVDLPYAKHIFNCPFVYELPRDIAKSIPKRLLTEKMSLQRWTFIDTIYIVFQDTYQAGFAKDLNTPHYQRFAPELFHDIQKYGASLNIKVIGLECHYCDNFIEVRNVGVAPPEREAPREPSRALLQMDGTSQAYDNRQRKKCDVGKTSMVNYTRRSGCPLGLAAPQCLAATRTPNGMAFFNILPTIRSYLETQLQNIPPGWKYQAARAAENRFDTWESDLTQIHVDAHNGKEPGQTGVGWQSWRDTCTLEDKGSTISVDSRQVNILYTRASHERYQREVCRWKGALEHVQTIYDGVADGRKFFCQATLDLSCNIQGLFGGLNLSKVPCNFDVDSYYSAFVANQFKLQIAFDLSFDDAIRVLCVMGQTLASALYSTVATEMILSRKKNICRAKYDVADLLRKTIKAIDGRKEVLPFSVPLRFGKYSNFEVLLRGPDCHGVISEMKRINQLAVHGGASAIKRGTYISLFHQFKTIEGVGDLSANHLVGIAARLGYIPAKMGQWVEGGALKFVGTMQKAGFCGFPPDELIENAGYALEACDETKTRWSEKRRENAVCKVGRLMSGSDRRFFDILDHSFPFVKWVRGTTFSVFDHDDEYAMRGSPLTVQCQFESSSDSDSDGIKGWQISQNPGFIYSMPEVQHRKWMTQFKVVPGAKKSKK